jgi:hypothetical protein
MNAQRDVLQTREVSHQLLVVAAVRVEIWR